MTASLRWAQHGVWNAQTLSNPGQRAHARCIAAEYVEQKLRFQSADWVKLPRKELWAAVVASDDADLKKMIHCITQHAGWPRDKVAVNMADTYKDLSGAIHDARLYQESSSAVDLVVPYPLQAKQARALQCIASAFNVPVKLKEGG